MLTEKDAKTLESILNTVPPEIGQVPDKLSEDPSEQALSPEQKAKIKIFDDLILKLDQENKFEEALQYCNQCIEFCPERAKSYNNRAQIYRLLDKDQQARHDIEICLELSERTGIAAAQAYIQRGSLKMKNGRKAAAIEDFKLAGKLRSKKGKEMALSLNDFAELCHVAVGEMMKGEIEGGL